MNLHELEVANSRFWLFVKHKKRHEFKYNV